MAALNAPGPANPKDGDTQIIWGETTYWCGTCLHYCLLCHESLAWDRHWTTYDGEKVMRTGHE
jgi:hypothetical protein